MKIVLLILMLFIAADVHAMRCGDEVVTTGDSVMQLQAKCGRPTRKEFSTAKYQNRWEAVEKWFYNCGENDFIYEILIIHSRIAEENSVGRGFGKSGCGR